MDNLKCLTLGNAVQTSSGIVYLDVTCAVGTNLRCSHVEQNAADIFTKTQ